MVRVRVRVRVRVSVRDRASVGVRRVGSDKGRCTTGLRIGLGV